MKIKKWLRIVVFFILICLVYSRLNHVLERKYVEDGTNKDNYVAEQFYSCEIEKVNLWFLGSSQTVQGISCMKLFEDYGIPAFSISSSAQPFTGSYYYLNEILKRHTPEMIILDTSMLFEEVAENGFRRVCDNAPLSQNKLNLIKEHYRFLKDSNDEMALDYLYSYFFPLLQFHSRWYELSQKDFTYEGLERNVFRGNVLNLNVNEVKHIGTLEEQDQEQDESEEDQMIQNQLNNFLKVMDLCKEKEIRVLLIKTPKNGWTWSKNRQTQALADQYGCNYIDFNITENFEAAGFSTKEDFSDGTHLNIRGALKLTDYLGEYLIQNEPSLVSDSLKPDPAELEQYHSYVKKGMVISASTPASLLKACKEGKYSIVLQNSEEIPEAAREAFAERLQILNLQTDWIKQGKSAFAGFLSHGKTVFQDASDSYVRYLDYQKKQNGKSLKYLELKSNGNQLFPVTWNGKDYVFNTPGLNLLIYDNDQVIQCVTIYYEKGKGLLLAREEVTV